jgi:hypothetical protein
MTKISALPQDTAPTLTDSIATVDTESSTTKRTLLSALNTLFFTQTNFPAGGGSAVTRDSEMGYTGVASGLVITADSVGVNRNASMTAGVLYINGLRISLNAVSARTYTASKDTYVDVLSNGDGTGTLVYTEVANGAASPALAANSARIGKVVTGATTIAATSSITQTGKDSLGNWIYLAQFAPQSFAKWRQGGASGNASWATQGSTNTDISAKKVFVQAGSLVMSAGGDVTVTFPVPFEQVPLVLGAANTAVGASTFAVIISVSTTQFTARLYTGSARAAEHLAWLEIGQ